MTEIFTAKTVEDAKAYAAEKFKTDIKNIKFEVMQEAKKGFLGLGAQDAKIKATYNPPAPSPEKKAEPIHKPVDLKREPVSVPKKAEEIPVKTEIKAAEETKAETVKPAEPVKPAAEEKPAETKEETVKTTEKNEPVKAEKASYSKERKPNHNKKYNSDKKKEFSKPEKQEKPVHEDDEADYAIENFTLIEDDSLIDPKVKLATDYITSILRAMDIDVDFEIYQNDTGAIVNINSANNGTIIGRRGETLDALQYLCSIIANKGDKDYYRITIDCLGYRNKRKETLEQLAAKVAKSVLRTGRSQPLEPMNPYERRVIHSAISEIEGVSSRSVGEEPYRKIIISSNNPRNNRRNNNSRNKRSENKKENFERRSVDLSTSFEKDYKRPKPEDEIGGGLYGKIEL